MPTPSFSQPRLLPHKSRHVYRVINARRQTVVAERVHIADRFWSRAIGLLGRQTLAPSDGLFFPRCASIHTWGMRFPIDVVMVDREGIIVDEIIALCAWKLLLPRDGVWGILELAAGVLARSGTTAGDLLVFEAIQPP